MDKAAVSFSKFLNSLGTPVFHEEWHGLPCVYVFDSPPTAIQYATDTYEIKRYSNPNLHVLGDKLARIAINEGLNFFRMHAVDWNMRRTAAMNLLRHKLGKSKKVCAARNTDLIVVPPKIANVFYGYYHIQGKTAGKHFGLVLGDELVACMTLSAYTPNRGGCLEEGAFNLSRFALAGHVPGAATRLFKFACTTLNAHEVVTFSDRTYARGEIYQLLGFEKDSVHPSDYRVWHPKLGLTHKAHWQRNVLHARLKELSMREAYDCKSDPRTEFEMCRLMGCRHVWDFGKIRWVWRRPQKIVDETRTALEACSP